MSVDNRVILIRIGGYTALLVAIFPLAFHLPHWATIIAALIAIVFFRLASRVSRKQTVDPGSGNGPIRQYPSRRMVWVLIAAVLTTTGTAPFWIPLSGVSLTLFQLCVCSALAAITSISVILIRSRRPKGRAREETNAEMARPPRIP